MTRLAATLIFEVRKHSRRIAELLRTMSRQGSRQMQTVSHLFALLILCLLLAGCTLKVAPTIVVPSAVVVPMPPTPPHVTQPKLQNVSTAPIGSGIVAAGQTVVIIGTNSAGCRIERVTIGKTVLVVTNCPVIPPTKAVLTVTPTNLFTGSVSNTADFKRWSLAARLIKTNSLTVPLTNPACFFKLATTNTFVVASTGKVELAWNANTDSATIGYHACYGLHGGSLTNVVVCAGELNTNCSIPGLAPGTTNDFYVIAYSAAGESLPASLISFVVPPVAAGKWQLNIAPVP